MDTNIIASIKGKKILYCVLNWGLGHASRSIPLIKQLIKSNELILASDGEAGLLLQKELPELKYLELPSYGIHYKYSSMHLNMLIQLPKIIDAYKQEHSIAKSIVKQNNIDLIISDHRYGCRKSGTKSIFLGHQIKILGSAPATKVNKYLINKFDECWIPDYQDRRLSGELSNTSGLKKYKFVGPLTRMEEIDGELKYDITIVLSGPEPRRSQLEAALLKQLKDTELRVCLVRGTKKAGTLDYSNLVMHDLLSSVKLNQVLAESKMIICRSGYSSIMDLDILKKPTLIIPTKGQKEQEYLAEHFSFREDFVIQQSNGIHIMDAYIDLGL